ncbi:MAG TPA: putative glycoside hydrolase [Candidatus Sulfotelmatobacter sp.]|nr:putative glycoside hydrolase [Candidatus Sulfotelmatobacter sp.]
MGRMAFRAFIVLVCGLAVSHAQESLIESLIQPRTQYFPGTHDNIHLEMVFNYNLANPKKEAGKVDMVWASNFPNQPAGVYNTSYIPYSVDNFTHTVKWYQRFHPDWLEYLCDRKTLAFEFGATTLAPIDFANPDVKAYQWKNWVDAPLAQGFGGIAVDTMSASSNWGRCGHYDRSGNWVQQYSGKSNDPTYQRDELNWEYDTYTHVHNYSKTATMQVNVSYEFGYSREVNLQLMTTADLLFDERGFSNYGSPPDVPPPAQWERIFDVLEYVQAKGVCYTTNGEESELTSEIPQSARLWVIANYLLVKNDCTYMYISGFLAGGGQDYGSLILFPEYSIQIGHPTGAISKTDGVYERVYSGGLTLVNPYHATATVTLPSGAYVDVNGNPVGPTVTMEAQTGLVLLKAE